MMVKINVPAVAKDVVVDVKAPFNRTAADFNVSTSTTTERDKIPLCDSGNANCSCGISECFFDLMGSLREA